MTREAYKSGRIKQAVQDGSREFITLLAYCSMTGWAGKPTLICKGERNEIQDSWVEDLGEEDRACFGATDNGWSNHGIALRWLYKVFDPETHKRSGNRRRLLVVDGHSSHVNMEFLNACRDLKIVLLIFPPHSTHRLQPLDLSVFLPLATQYTNQLNKLHFGGVGSVFMTKRMFWPMFKVAFEDSFTVDNIMSGWRKAGLYPFDPSVVIRLVRPTKRELLPEIECARTPMTSKSMRRLHRLVIKAPTPGKMRILFKATTKLAARHEIDLHDKTGLYEALVIEKKKRQRGRKLNLKGEPSGGAQLFDEGDIQEAQDYQAAKDAEEAAEKARKAAKRDAIAARKADEALQKSVRAHERTEKKSSKQCFKTAR